MTSQVTQCPKCQTSFRVTDTQLNIANGAVRCGSCLHIFDAPAHWLDTTQPPLTQEEYNIDDDFLNDEFDDGKLFSDTGEHDVLDQIFEDDDNDSMRLTDESLHLTSAYSEQQESESLPGIIIDDDDANDIIIDDDDDELIDDDEPLFEDTIPPQQPELDEGMLGSNNHKPHRGLTGEYSETFLGLDQWEEDPSSVYKELDELGDMEEAGDEEWAKQLLEDEEEEDRQAQEKPAAFEPTTDIFDSLEEVDEPVVDEELLDILNQHEDFSSPPQPQPSAAPSPLPPRGKVTVEQDEFILGMGEKPMLTGAPIASHSLALLASIEPEPVVMAFKRQRGDWTKYGWVAAIVLAILALIGQHLTFNFERLSRDTQMRPFMAKVCNIAGCELPGMDDIRLIQSSNLMVRSHPNVNNALVVDAIITNRADFQQRFPVMELQFTDLTGDIVAGRRFTPEQYLAGELTGASMMPTRQPIYISLEIVDPGQDAVNYQLYFHSQRGG